MSDEKMLDWMQNNLLVLLFEPDHSYVNMRYRSWSTEKIEYMSIRTTNLRHAIRQAMVHQDSTRQKDI